MYSKAQMQTVFDAEIGTSHMPAYALISSNFTGN